MKTSIIGYPRIGKLRELKFASENILEMKLHSQSFSIQQKS